MNRVETRGITKSTNSVSQLILCRMLQIICQIKLHAFMTLAKYDSRHLLAY